jgi:Na+/H+-dicarboxylate symporter
LFFGGILTTLGERGRPVLAFFEAVNDVVMKMVHLIMYFAPLGVFALIAYRLGKAGGGGLFWMELAKLLKYALTVITGLLIHGVFVLPIILWVLGRRNPARYAFNMGNALTTAFSTASSSATLPLTMECAEEKNSVSNRAASFVLPLGATVNMDGTALYEAVAAIFIAQAYGVPLAFPQQVVIFITATLAAIGAAGIPEAGLVTMVIVLKSVGLPLEGIGLLLSIDWFLDRFRTTVNVWGDSVGAAIIDRLESGYSSSTTAADHT